MGQVQSFDEGSELKYMQWTELSPNFLLNYSEYGFAAELLGIENINGVEYYVIQYSNDEDSTLDTYYFEIESGLLRTSKNTTNSEGGTVTSTMEYNKYIDLGDGILFPLEVKTQSGPQSTTVRISTVEINTTIDPSKISL